MSTLADRLAELTAGHPRGWQARLAEHCGVKAPSVSDWLSGKTQSLEGENLLCAAEYFAVNPHWLATGKGPKWLDAAVQARESQPAYSPLAEAADHVIHQYRAGGAMGHGLILEDKQPGIIKSWHVDQEWLRLNVRHHTGVKNLCIVTGFGPSMRGMFNPGDPLLCDTGVTVCDTDAVYFFRVGEHGFIKLLQRIPILDGLVIRAKSKNPDYEPFDIVKGMDFEIFGKILTVWKSEQF